MVIVIFIAFDLFQQSLKLTKAYDESRASFSLNFTGTMIAFGEENLSQFNPGSVFLINRDGSALNELPKDFAPVISPDGSKVVLYTIRDVEH
jgi:hypothetical protein